MRFTRLEQSVLALIALFCGTVIAMYITEQVTHQPLSPVWQLPFGGIAVLWGIHMIRFRQELADRYNEGVKRYRWIGRTGDPYIDPVLYVLPGAVAILFGILMMVTGVVKVL